MSDDDYEPNRVLGFAFARDRQARQDEEPRRVLGFAVDSSAGVDLDFDWLRSLAHPIRGYRRWLRRRRLGPYATDEDE